MNQKQNEFKCEKCEKFFSSRKKYYKHNKTHEVTPCEYCGKKFFNAYQLDIHTKRHNGEKPYQCDECEESFQRKGELMKHKFDHKNPVEPCSLCGMSFSKFSSRLVKQKSAHVCGPKFNCKVCGKEFSQSSSLNQHNNSHTFDGCHEEIKEEQILEDPPFEINKEQIVGDIHVSENQDDSDIRNIGEIDHRSSLNIIEMQNEIVKDE